MSMQRSASSDIVPSAAPPIVNDVLQSPGQPLDSSSRALMEPRFGQDFSNVRVHADSQAAQSATDVNALAYTVGRDVVFGPGQYAPQSEAGKRLLAHELTHVVQQASRSIGPDAETRAEHSARLAVRGETVPPSAAGSAPVSLQKAGKDDAPLAPGTASSAGAPATATPPATGSAEPPVDEFEFDKSTIPPQHLDHLNGLRTKLINAPAATVVLTGHTDTVGTEKYNKDLGLKRAEAVRDFLTKKNGVNPGRIKVISMGEGVPATGQPPAKIDPDKGEKNPKNRRVEIQVDGMPASSAPPAGRTLDPTNPTGKKKPFNPMLPPDYQFPPPKPAPDKDKPGPSTTGSDKKEGGGPEVEAAVVATGDGIETTIELTWEAKSGPGKTLGSEIKFTVHVGPQGFSQLEADLTVLKKKIADKVLGGTVRGVTFSMGFNPALNIDKDKAGKLVTTFSEKLKASLEFDAVIPKTKIKVPIELSPSIDSAGNAGFEFKVTLWKF
jgi:outer membrane protein OmpA-like peptidoglycan-associated protein